MNYYLSSFRFGKLHNRFLELKKSANNIVAYIPNAIDFIDDLDFKRKIMSNDISDLEALGLEVRVIYLNEYFRRENELRDVLEDVGYIWVTGGNAFVLNQCFKLSGFSNILRSYSAEDRDIVYGGFSCATYILCNSLKGFELVDYPDLSPYNDEVAICWDGVGLIDYAIIPHYKSSLVESKLIDKVVDYMHANNIEYKTIRDGEVIIIE